ncbi:MAG TPA: Xaa-Pro peptidase family protein [Acidimicrobiales bacterium]|jgi:Xaa-Pro aminopeptidase
MTPTDPAGAGLPAMDVAGRLVRLREGLADAGCDGLVVTSLTNIRYLTGFTGSAGLLVVLPAEAVLITDGRYGVQAPEQIRASGAEARVEVAGGSAQRDAATAAVAGLGRLGLEAAHVSWAQQRAYGGEWFEGLELVPTVGLVEGLRRVKDAGELFRMLRAARIADEALGALLPSLAGGPTEVEFGRALDFAMRERGASGPAFETIVASGPNAAKPHHRPSERVVVEGDLVVVDFGATFDGYRSDMTRTVWVGEPATAEQARIYAVVAASQAAGVAAVAPGVPAADIDRVCRQVIADAGWAEQFVHGTGHGVGLDIHEAPSVASSSSDTLSPGHVITVEPGVYLPGVAGVRIEDTVVVTDDGCDLLTFTPKDLRV